jgi:hypothetical protein
MPKDPGTWGLYISVIALVLIVPLGILTNVLTPKLQNWWAGRSKASLEKRIEKLKHDLLVFKTSVLLTEAEQQIFRGLESVHRFVWFVGYFILSLIGMLGFILMRKEYPLRWAPITGQVFFIGCITSAYISMLFRLREYRMKHSPDFALRTEAAISKLSMELSKYDPSK